MFLYSMSRTLEPYGSPSSSAGFQVVVAKKQVCALLSNLSNEVLERRFHSRPQSPTFLCRRGLGRETLGSGDEIDANMDTGSGARQKDFQNVFQNSDIKERKNLLAKVLHFPEFNEEDDLRPAILVEVYYDMLAYLVNNGLPWREVSSLWEIFQNLLNEAQGEQLDES